MGQGRTYLPCPDDDPRRLPVATACSNLLAGRAWVSMGLLPQLIVDETFGVGDLATGLGAQVRVSVKVLGPSWVTATNVALFSNGTKIREADLREHLNRAPTAEGDGVKGQVEWMIPRPRHDVHLVVIATGPAVTAPFWAIPRAYQPVSPHWEGRVIGSTNPIWLDADGDGRFTCAREYARQLVARHGPGPRRLLPALRDFDEAVAAQAASLCAAAGCILDAPDVAQALETAAPQVRRGFTAYAATQKENGR